MKRINTISYYLTYCFLGFAIGAFLITLYYDVTANQVMMNTANAVSIAMAIVAGIAAISGHLTETAKAK